MSQTIVRLFASGQTAFDAAAALKSEGYRADHMFVVAPKIGTDTEAVAAEIAATMVPKSKAMIFAQHLPSGGGVVTVHALFGTAMMAMEILDGFNPIESGVAEFSDAPPPWDEAAPLSSALQWGTSFSNPAPVSDLLGIPPVINCPTPLSKFFGLPVLARISNVFGFAQLLDSSAPYKGVSGAPLLIDSPTPLSSLLHIPTLIKGR